MKQAIIITILILMLTATAHAEPKIDKFAGKTIFNGIIELSFSVSDSESSLSKFEVYKDGDLLTKGTMSGNSYSDVFDDTNTDDGKTYTYKLLIQSESLLTNSQLINVTADSKPPKITSAKNVTSSNNTLIVETDEDSDCIAGLSETNLKAMTGKTKSHSIELGFVNGLNYVLVSCKDSSGNKMINPTIINYVFDSEPPGKIRGLEVKPENGALLLTWEKAYDANGIKEYLIYKGVDQDNLEVVGKSTVTKYTDSKSLVKGTKYYYAVKAVDNPGNDGYISDIEVVTMEDSVVNLEATATAYEGNKTIITGTAKPISMITAKIGDKSYDTKSLSDGTFEISTDYSDLPIFITATDTDNNTNSINVTPTVIKKPAPVVVNNTNLTTAPPAATKTKTTSYNAIIIAVIVVVVFLLLGFYLGRKTSSGDRFELDNYLRAKRKKEKFE